MKTPQGQCCGLNCCCLVAKWCLTLYDPMDCSLPGSSVHGISQARTLEWVDTSFSRGLPHPGTEPLLQGSSPPQDLTPSTGVFPTRGLNLGLLHLLPWQVGSSSLSHQGTLGTQLCSPKSTCWSLQHVIVPGKRAFNKSNKIKMRLLGWVVLQSDCVFIKKEIGFWDTRDEPSERKNHDKKAATCKSRKEASRETQPAGILVFQTPELRDLLAELLGDILLWQPEQAHMDSDILSFSGASLPHCASQNAQHTI